MHVFFAQGASDGAQIIGEYMRDCIFADLAEFWEDEE